MNKVEGIYGKSSGPIDKHQSAQLIKDMMKEDDIECKISITNNSFVCALQTPLMARAVMKLDLARDIMFLDTSGTMDRSVIYIFMII